jgi:hypothetical protein
MPDVCRICGNQELDVAWEVLAGASPGEAILHIGRMRHSRTGLELMKKWLPDDNGVPRCLTCLRQVPKDRATPSGWIYPGPNGTWRIQPGVIRYRIETGYEALCCGAAPTEPGPLRADGELHEEVP